MTEIYNNLHICGNILSSKNYNYFALQCIVCSESFGQWTSFLRHLEENHKNSEIEDLEQKEIKDDLHEIDDIELKQEEVLIEVDVRIPAEELHSVYLKTKNEAEVSNDEPMFEDLDKIEKTVRGRSGQKTKFSEGVFDENLFDSDEYLSNNAEESESEIEKFVFSLSDKKYRSISLEFLKVLRKNRCLWDTQHNDYRKPRRRSASQSQIKLFFKTRNVDISNEGILSLISSILEKYKKAQQEEENEDISIEAAYLLKRCSFLQLYENPVDNYIDLDENNGKETESENNTEDEPIASKTKIKNRIKFTESHPIVEEFIELLKENKVLWDTSLHNYNNRIDRKIIFNSWAEKFKLKHDIEFTYDEIAYAALEFRRIYFKALKRRDDNEELDKFTLFVLEKGSFLPPKQVKRNIKCQHCVKKFQQEYTLKRHIYVDHGIGEMPFECSFCGQRFDDHFIHRRHELRYHYKDYQYDCEYCKKLFFTREERDRHLAKHTGQKRFVCELCGNPFSKKINLRNHVTRVHMRQRNFPCNLCPKAFYTKALLQDHLNAHFNIRDKVCTTCGKGFTSYHSLMRHKQIHSEVKRYACKLCDARFHQLVGLNSHMKNTHKFVKNKNETASDEEFLNLIDSSG